MCQESAGSSGFCYSMMKPGSASRCPFSADGGGPIMLRRVKAPLFPLSTAILLINFLMKAWRRITAGILMMITRAPGVTLWTKMSDMNFVTSPNVKVSSDSAKPFPLCPEAINSKVMLEEMFSKASIRKWFAYSDSFSLSILILGDPCGLQTWNVFFWEGTKQEQCSLWTWIIFTQISAKCTARKWAIKSRDSTEFQEFALHQ